MRSIICFLSPVFFIIFSCSSPAGQEESKAMRTVREVTFSGKGYELGLQHGKALKKEIAEIVNLWKENTSRQLEKDADAVLQDFFEYANFTADIKKWTPDLYEEVRGIADGAERKFNEILVLNLLDEFWVYVDDLANHHCSDLGVPARDGNPAFVAQNMDIEKYTDGYQTLMRIQGNDSLPEQLILTHPGLIALNGMNEKAVGVVVNTIMQLQASSSGLPVAFVVRKIIRSTEKEDLLKFVQEVNHASGQSYIIGIDGEVFNFEASANKVVRHQPDNPNGTVYHTNHPIVNDDLKDHFMVFMPGQENNQEILSSNTYIRLDAVKKRMVGNVPLDREIIQSTLQSKDDTSNPVCRNITPNSYGFTFASTIMTLSESPQLMVSPGPPDLHDYQTFSFNHLSQ